MPERYTIIDNETNETFNLGACNMADIKGLFRDVDRFIRKDFDALVRPNHIPVWEEFYNTKAVLDKIKLPNMDY